MIQNHTFEPTFTPRGQSALEKGIANQQIAKAARAEVEAISAKDNANYRLEKATAALKLAQVEYLHAVEKSAWNVDILKAAYNNALAGFREADKAAEIAAAKLATAESFIAGLRKKAGKAVAQDDSSDDSDYSDYSDESDSSDEDSSVEKDAGDDSGDDTDDLDAQAEQHERLSGVARQMGDMDAHAFHSAEAGRLRAKMITARAAKTNTKKSASDFIAKREFSDKKRAELAEKGHALPDGSFPIETKADIDNAVQSVGRAKDYDAAKKHIVARAKDLGAESQLPKEWNKKAKMEKDIEKAALMILCPNCMGMNSEACEGCDDNGLVMPNMAGTNLGSEPMGQGVAMSAFSTDSLLTRDFQKSVAYQAYIISKGDVEGHVFHGNQYVSTSNQSSEARKLADAVAGGKANSQTAEAQHRNIARALEGGSKMATNVGMKRLATAYDKAAQAHRDAAAAHIQNMTSPNSKVDVKAASEKAADASAKADELAYGDAGIYAGRTVPVKDKDAPQPIDPKWNARTSGPLINMPLRGIQIGFNDLMKEYEGNIKVHGDIATKLEGEAKKAASDGDIETAANKMDEASREWEKSAAAARAIFAMHEKYEQQGVKGANSQDPKVAAFREMARQIRANQKQAAADKAAALADLANEKYRSADKANDILGK
jgi:hypothetical protein